jgi:hypothetical protein
VDPTTCWFSGHGPGLWLSDPRYRHLTTFHSLYLITNNAVASGLYYLSELVEEHTVIAKRLLSRLIYSIIAVQVLLLLDGFPPWYTILSIGSHIVYLGNMRRFPVVKLSDPLFLTSCGICLPIYFKIDNVANT